MMRTSLPDRVFETYVERYNTPTYEFDINFVRAFICLFFIWKLLSRDFGFYGTLPEDVFYFYPIEVYPLKSYILFLGLPILNDIATFHWVHWILPHPGVTGMRFIQAITIAVLLVVLVFGRGPRRLFIMAAYGLLIYLWGYLLLLGQEIDSVLLYFGMLLMLVVSNYDDQPIWSMKKLYSGAPTVQAGRAYSNFILVFVFYYFASGLRKLTDISFVEWTNYQLIEGMQKYAILADNTTRGSVGIFEPMFGLTFLSPILPTFVYLSHLSMPLVFFRREMIIHFFLFYTVFHIMTFGVGISFTGYIFVWLVLFPFHKLLDYWLRTQRATGAEG